MPLPDPETTKTAIEASSLTWEAFGTIVGTVVAVLGFLAGIIWKIFDSRKAKDETKEEEKKDDVEIENLKQKQKETEDLVRKLQEDYNTLKTEIALLKSKDETTAKDIEKLEGNIDRIIDMLLKALSEDRL